MLFEAIATIIARLTTLAGGGGEWNGAKVGLYKSTFIPGTGMTYADFAAKEADFTGYARSSAITWGTPYADASNRGVLVGGSKQFTSTDGDVPNTITGFVILNSAGNAILWAEDFASAWTVNAANQARNIVPKYVYGRQAA